MPTKIGKSLSYHKKFKFIVEIDDFASSAWTKCSELKMEIAKIEQWQGGALIPNKSLGRVTFTDVTLERGVTQDENCYDWMLNCADVVKNSGLVDDEYKREVDIIQQDRDNKSLRKWGLEQSFPIAFSAGEWDNTSDENVMESVTLTFDQFVRKSV